MSKITELKGYINQLYGMELLEYEDKNLLGYDDKRGSEIKQNILVLCREILDKYDIVDLADIRSK